MALYGLAEFGVDQRHREDYVSSVGDNDNIPILSNGQSLGNYPNPFNPHTRIIFSLNIGQHVQIKIYNIAGRLVRVLVDEFRAKGSHFEVWDGNDERGLGTESGVYLVRMVAKDGVSIKR